MITSDCSSDSESVASEVVVSRTNRRQIKPQKFNGKGLFENFYAHFKTCSDYNRWNKAD